ncbi:hypothetical protein ES703_122743 [subsurface metagenome]
MAKTKFEEELEKESGSCLCRMCEGKGLDHTGGKDVLIARLVAFEAKATEPEPEPEPEPCPVCGKTHKEGSAIGEEHKAEAEAKAKAEAQASIKEAVDNAELPEAAKARLIERFAEATTDDGVAEAIKAEAEAEAGG